MTTKMILKTMTTKTTTSNDGHSLNVRGVKVNGKSAVDLYLLNKLGSFYIQVPECGKDHCSTCDISLSLSEMVRHALGYQKFYDRFEIPEKNVFAVALYGSTVWRHKAPKYDEDAKEMRGYRDTPNDVDILIVLKEGEGRTIEGHEIGPSAVIQQGSYYEGEKTLIAVNHCILCTTTQHWRGMAAGRKLVPMNLHIVYRSIEEIKNHFKRDYGFTEHLATVGVPLLDAEEDGFEKMMKEVCPSRNVKHDTSFWVDADGRVHGKLL